MSPPNPPARAFSYLRFSTAEQAGGDSARRQLAMTAAYCAQRGLELDQHLSYADEGVSAFRGRNGETGRLADFRTAVVCGLVPAGSYLLIESLDRLSRQAARKALRVLEDICDQGITVVTLDDGRVYTADALERDPVALLMAILTMIRANEESERKASRLRAAWQNKRAKAQTGTVMTSSGPSWLRQVNGGGWEVIEERAEIVRRIFRDTLAGKGQLQIAAELNQEGVPVFGRGKHWYRSYVYKLLRSPAVVGTLVPRSIAYSGTVRRRMAHEPVTGYFPAIIDPTDFHTVQALAESRNPQRGRNARDAVQNILGAVAKCGLCGGSMTRVCKGSKRRDGAPRLVCNAARSGADCVKMPVPYEQIESALVTGLRAAIEACPPADTEAERLAGEMELNEHDLAELGDLIDELVRLMGNRPDDPPLSLQDRIAGEFRRLDELKAERRQLQEKMVLVSGPLVKHRLALLLAAIEADPLDRQAANAALRAAASAVVIDPRTGGIVVKWRHGGSTDLPSGA